MRFAAEKPQATEERTGPAPSPPVKERKKAQRQVLNQNTLVMDGMLGEPVIKTKLILNYEEAAYPSTLSADGGTRELCLKT